MNRLNSDLRTTSIPPVVPHAYFWDEASRLFRRENVVQFGYTDGQEVEKRLLECVSSAADRSTFSPEMARLISDWPSEYHLSRSRHCLVRPLGIRPGQKVLEAGCGCGAITRYLGEIGADVVGVEASMARAQVAAERCRDLPNVRVFVDDLVKFETNEKFDWIMLVGVLEYAALFANSERPFEHYLRSVSRLTVSGGRVVVAIENKLGLKYFNGCSEDHLGIPYFGVQDLYGHRSPRTFGRRELIDCLATAGLSDAYFYYPFPDYKLPSVILSQDALIDRDFDPADLLARSHARDYSGGLLRSFDEALVFSSLASNGLLSDLSNSFLVVATTGGEIRSNPEDIAVTYSVSHRAPEFAIQTRFHKRDSKLRVLKEHLAGGEASRFVAVNGMTVSNVLEDEEYCPGRQVLWRLLKTQAVSGEAELIVQALLPWMNFLLAQALSPAAHAAEPNGRAPSLRLFKIPGHFLDCTRLI